MNYKLVNSKGTIIHGITNVFLDLLIFFYCTDNTKYLKLLKANGLIQLNY